MGRSNKFEYKAIIERELIAQPDGLSLDELLACCGLKVDRSTLFRHLAQLIEKGRVERIGNARASRYRWLNSSPIDATPAQPLRPRLVIQPVPAFLPPHPRNGAPFPVHPLPQAGHTEAARVPAEAVAYGAVVKKAVRTVVREWKRCDPVNLQIYLSLLVDTAQLDEVSAAVEKELAGLREGDLSRFELSLADFLAFTPPAGRAATDQ